MEYEIYYDPIWALPAILEDRKEGKRGNRYILVARSPEGVEICMAVPSDLSGPNATSLIEVVQQLSPIASRINRHTEEVLLGAWGLA